MIPKPNTTKGGDLGTLSDPARKFVDGPPHIPELMMKTVLYHCAEAEVPRVRLLETLKSVQRTEGFELAVLDRYATLIKPVVARSTDPMSRQMLDILNAHEEQSVVDEIETIYMQMKDQELRTCASSIFCCARDLPITASQHLAAVEIPVSKETLSAIREHVS